MSDSPIVRELIATLAEEFLEDRRSLTTRLVERVHSDPAVPGDGELRTATAEAGAGVVRQLLVQLRDGGDMAALSPPHAAVVYAHEFAHRGIDLAVLLAVVRAGYAEFSRQWSERLGREAPPSEVSVDALSTSLLEIFAYIDMVSTAFAVAYSDERQRWSRSLEALRLDVVRVVLDGDAVDTELASQRLGQRLDTRHRAFVIWSDAEPVLGLRDALEAAAAALGAAAAPAGPAASGAPLVVPLSGQVLAGWLSGAAAAAAEPQLAAALGAERGAFDVRAAVGEAGDGIAGFRASHRQALHACRVARALGDGAARLTDYRAVALVALASGDPDHAREFVASELGQLAAGDRATRRIAETVRVFLQEGRSRARTSRELDLHTNTIAYRLQRGAELLGHPLDERATEVALALALAPVIEERA
jgi:DNA-binding PucR family transcriptional regulator